MKKFLSRKSFPRKKNDDAPKKRKLPITYYFLTHVRASSGSKNDIVLFLRYIFNVFFFFIQFLTNKTNKY